MRATRTLESAASGRRPGKYHSNLTHEHVPNEHTMVLSHSSYCPSTTCVPIGWHAIALETFGHASPMVQASANHWLMLLAKPDATTKALIKTEKDARSQQTQEIKFLKSKMQVFACPVS